LKSGAKLLSSDTQKYDVKDNECGFTAPGANKSGNLNDILTEKIHQQRKILNKKLGIDVGDAAKLDTTHIFSDYDLIVSSTAEITQHQHECASTSSADADPNVLGNLKRKLENANETQIDQSSIKQEEIINDIKKFKKSDSFLEPTNLNANETELNHVKSLELFTQWLLNKLFDSDWEIRHGAATSLREIIKGLVYSLMRYFKEEENSNGIIKREHDKENLFLHLNWFQDCLVKMLSVIALDRFADYVGDEAVAPVREVNKKLFSIS